ncbi:DUF192 domain-containing protein [Candidatus Woesearchaeota archaeon]|nr:DUF192 domain-containing protein [Candidatus Woesearchaeota archaeon]
MKYFNGFGLMFKRKLKENEAVILKINKESRLKASVHMFFVFYSLCIIWLDKDKKVVDIKKVHPFQPLIAPRHPAIYIIECIKMPAINVGDVLNF